MALDHRLISQFAKLVTENKKQSSESTVYGTVVDQYGNKPGDVDSDGNPIVIDENGGKYIRPDGSDQLIPITENDVDPAKANTTTNIGYGNRTSVLIKNHTATVTGNISSPAANDGDIETAITKFDIAVGDQLQANKGYFKDLTADKANMGNLVAAIISVAELIAKDVKMEELVAGKITVDDLIAKKIDTDVVIAESAIIDKLKSDNIDVLSLIADKAVIEELIANNATLDSVEAKNAYLKFANIDFSNIGKAAMEYFYANSGLIDNVQINDATISGNLVGVTITGDLIKGNTIVADKLVIKGTDGIYYKLNINNIVHHLAEYDSSTGEYTILDDILENFEGELGTDYIYVVDAYTTDGDQVFEYISENNDNIPSGTYFCKRYMNDSEPLDFSQVPSDTLHGSIITANSITAEKVNVSDLVAFDATIGGFHITNNAIYSGTKESVDNSNSGSYLDSEGQFAFGDMENYIRYYKVVDEEGNESYKLEIAAESILFGSGSKRSTSDLKDLMDKVYIGSYEDPDTGEKIPCIELYEGNVESGNVRQFRLRLTNKDATFMDGASDTRIDSDGLTTEKVVANNEIVQTYTRSNNNTPKGEWVWKARPNGNYGLMWKGVTS